MNRAKRLLAVLDVLLSMGDGQGRTCGQVWSIALGVGEIAKDAEMDTAVLAMQAFRAEVELAAVQLKGLDFDAALYKGQFKRLRNAALPAHSNAEWRGMIGNINQPDTRLALAWAAAVLPDDEAELPQAELDSLSAEFDSLAAALEDADLPPAMRDYATKQLRSLRSALQMYKVRGVAAVNESLEQAFGAAHRAAPAMKAEAASAPLKAKSYIERVNGFVSRSMTVLGEVERAHKGGSSMLSMAENLGKLIGAG